MPEMEQKMSVGLETNAISIGMPGQPWVPTPSPTLKLQTPALEPLAVGNSEWRGPLSAQPNTSHPQSTGANFATTGLTPRYSPAFAASPGVSADIAGVVDNGGQPSTSLSDLFASPDYPFSRVSNPTRSPNPKTPATSQPQTAAKPNQRQSATVNPSPPAASAPTATAAPPPSAASQTAAQQAQSVNKSGAQPTMSFAASTAAFARSGQGIPGGPPPLGMPTGNAFSAPMSQALSQPMAPPAALGQYAVNAPLSQPVATVSGVATNAAAAAAAPVNYAGYSVLTQQPQGLPSAAAAATAAAAAAAAGQPVPGVGVGQRQEAVIAPLPTRTEDVKKAEAAVMPTTGHRSVLGSGIVSSAVQEAQVRARLKAENFAKMRKRKRHDEPTEEDKEKQSEEDAKLTPEQLRKKRYMRRLALNRESAAVSRVRRREYVKLLEEQLVNAEKERVRLATELSEMQRQHNKLREHLEKLERNVQEGGGEQLRSEGFRQ